MQELTEIFGWLVSFVENYGYFAVFLGSMIEGESVIFLAGFFAHEGYLSLYNIIIISFMGTLFADQTLYHIGRHYGSKLFDRIPSIKPRAERAFVLLKRYDTLFILSFRFIYGIRIISPLVIGSCGIETKRFTVLNFVAALIWSVLSCLAAYFFAHLIMDKVHLLPKLILCLVLLGAGIGFIIFKWQNKTHRQQ